jgi:hypothetical protein
MVAELTQGKLYRIDANGEAPFVGTLVNKMPEPMAPSVNGKTTTQWTYVFNVDGQDKEVQDYNIKSAVVQEGGRRKTRKAKKSKKSKKSKSRKSRR